MEKITQVTLAWDLFGQGVPKARIAQHLGRNRETIIVWLQGVQQHGLDAFLQQHQTACKQPRPARQVRLTTKQLIWAIREREHGCCGQKIAYFLQKEHQIHLSVPKIYEVLAEKYTLRAKGRKNHKRGDVPEATAARQVIQMDTVHFGQIFAFTAVDIFTPIKPQPGGRRAAAPQPAGPGRRGVPQDYDAAPLRRVGADHPDRRRQ